MKEYQKWIYLAGVILILSWAWWFISIEPYPTKGWDTMEEVFSASDNTYHNVYYPLESTRLDLVDFKQVNLEEATEKLFQLINSERAKGEELHFEILEDEFEDHRFDLKLETSSAVESLHYVTSLGMAKYRIREDETIEIRSLRNPNEDKVYEVDFRYIFSLTRIHHAAAPVDVTKELESLGVDLEWAKYYPDELRLRVRGNRSEIELVEMYADLIHWSDSVYSKKVRYHLRLLNWLDSKKSAPATSIPSFSPGHSAPSTNLPPPSTTPTTPNPFSSSPFPPTEEDQFGVGPTN